MPDNIFEAENKDEATYQFKETMKLYQLYHFKVISLRSHEDTRREKDHEGGSECKLVFHFFHKLLEPYKEKDKCEDFDWYLRDDNIR